MENLQRPIRRGMEKVAVPNYLVIHKHLKKLLRAKRAKKVFHYLQMHKPDLPEHNDLYLEISLKCVAKLIHCELIKHEPPTLTFLEKFEQMGFQLIEQTHENFHCEQSCLKGNTKVREGLDKHIDTFWISVLDFLMYLSMGYHLNQKWEKSFGLLRIAEQLGVQLMSSSTSNKALLRKVVKVRSILGRVYYEIGDYKSSIASLQNALNICVNQLIIRDREKDSERKGHPQQHKHWKQFQECKMTILRLLLKLCSNYDMLQQYDMVPFVMNLIQSLMVEWKTEKSSGFYKFIEHIDSKECLSWYVEYDSTLNELKEILNLTFDMGQILKAKEERRSAFKPRRRVMTKIQTEEPQNQLIEDPKTINMSNQPEKQSIVFSLKQSRQDSNPQSATTSQSGMEPSCVMNLTQQLLDIDQLQLHKVKRKTLNYRKEDQRQITSAPQNKFSEVQTQPTKGGQVSQLIQVVLSGCKPQDRFYLYSEASTKMRRLSVNIKKQFNEIEFEMCKIRSRSNLRKRAITKGQEFDLNTLKVIDNKASIPVMGREERVRSTKAKASVPANLMFHDALLRHKEQLDLKKLFVHLSRNPQKQNISRLSRTKSKRIAQSNNRQVHKMAATLYERSKQGIDLLKEQIKDKYLQRKQKTPPRVQKPIRKVRESRLFLTSLASNVEQL